MENAFFGPPSLVVELGAYTRVLEGMLKAQVRGLTGALSSTWQLIGRRWVGRKGERRYRSSSPWEPAPSERSAAGAGLLYSCAVVLQSHILVVLESLLVCFSFYVWDESSIYLLAPQYLNFFFLIAQINVKHTERQRERAGPLPWCRQLQPSCFLKVLPRVAHQLLSCHKYNEICAGSNYGCRDCVQKIFSFFRKIGISQQF